MKSTATIPNPLRSGDYILYHATYTGDVGSTEPNNQPVLMLTHRAAANVTVEGIGDPIPVESSKPHYAIFEIKGHDTLDMTLGGGRLSPYGPGIATVNLEPGARLSGNVAATLDGHVTINGGHGARLINYSGQIDGGSAIINPAIEGIGTIALTGGGPSAEASLELGGRVAQGETISIADGNLLLDKPMQFLGTIDWLIPHEPVQSATLSGVFADSYSLASGELHLFSGNRDFLDLKLVEQPGATLNVFQTDGGVVLSILPPASSLELPLHHTG